MCEELKRGAVLCCALALLPFANVEAAEERDLDRLKASYLRKIESVCKPLEERLGRDLLNLETTLANASKLEAALAVRESRVAAQIHEGVWKPLPADLPNEPPDLKRKVLGYVRELESLCRPWSAKYLDALQKLKRRKIAEKSLEEALAIDKEIAKIKAESTRRPEGWDLKGKRVSGNVAAAARGSKASAPERPVHLTDGDYTRESFSAGPVPARFVVEFDQLYVIDEVKVLFWNGDDRKYFYKIEASVDGKKWDTVDDRSRQGGSDWETHTFEKRDAIAIRLEGLKNSANQRFHVVEIEVR